METLWVKSATFELLTEIFERLPADRLCAIECNRPVAEVEFVDFFITDAAHAQVIGKVGSTAARRAIAADRSQPTRRALQECHGRHQGDREACAKRLENSSNQPHVVVGRQPEYG